MRDLPAYLGELHQLNAYRRLKATAQQRLLQIGDEYPQLDLLREAKRHVDYWIACRIEGPERPVLAWRNWLEKAALIAEPADSIAELAARVRTRRNGHEL